MSTTSPFRILSNQEFLAPVVERNTAAGGGVKDPRLLERMKNPICQQCHENYRKKFPGRAFEIVCDGVYQEEDFQQISQDSEIPVEDVRELMDPCAWAERHITIADEHGDFHPFQARDYQEPILRCTAKRKVDRMGRGLGKTVLGLIEELRIATMRKNYPILVLCPKKAQAQKWYDDLLGQIERDPELSASLKNRKQQPYYQLEFHNGATISIFTAGSQSGREADVIRSQSPRRVRLEEQDYLTEGDYKAVMPLVRRYKESEVHGASTPTGARSTYWQMCQKYPDYREFYAPITVHPDWSEKMEEACRREARTEMTYLHEFMAEFGDLEQGVFKAVHVDGSRRPYRYKDVVYDATKNYIMGVDWNGQGTGTRIRVVEFDPVTHIRKVVAAQAVDGPGTTTWDSINTIRDMNRIWHCYRVFVDAGFANLQDELLKQLGQAADNEDDKRLRDIQVIDFGAKLITNRLVSKRPGTKYLEDSETERSTKPFMVEGAVMVLEQGFFEFSDSDDILDSQFRSYRVKTWSQHGYANTYTCGSEGDHDLDATMLALLGIEMCWGMLQTQGRKALARVSHVAGFGQQGSSYESAQKAAVNQNQAKQASQVPTRAVQSADVSQQLRVLYMSRNLMYAVPASKQSAGAVPSRTSMFRRGQPGKRT